MRTSKADYNYLSLTPEGATLFAGSDHASTTEMPPVLGAVIQPPTPSQYSAILKLSRMDTLRLDGIKVSQGRENALDCNSCCARIGIDGEFGQTGEVGDQVVTVKGGCTLMRISGVVHSQGHRAHVCCGVWSDQSNNTSSNLDFSGLSHVTGAPLTFILSRVNSPIMAALGRPKDIVLPKGAKVLFWASIADQIYWWGKLAAVKMGLLKSVK